MELPASIENCIHNRRGALQSSGRTSFLRDSTTSPAPLRRAGNGHRCVRRTATAFLRHRTSSSICFRAGSGSICLHYHLPNAGWWRQLLKALVSSNHFPLLLSLGQERRLCWSTASRRESCLLMSAGLRAFLGYAIQGDALVYLVSILLEQRHG